MLLLLCVVFVCRFNKYIKSLCRDSNRAEINLANTTTLDAAAHFKRLQRSKSYDISKDCNHKATLIGRKYDYSPAQDVIDDLRADHRSGIVDSESCVGFRRAHIMGTPFTAGEWPKHPRCGSVITVVKDGRSLFARVINFFQVIDDVNPGYAHVQWFSEPDYLYADNPLGARCRVDGSVLNHTYGRIVRITEIVPSQIMVERDGTDVIMIRDSGYNVRTYE